MRKNISISIIACLLFSTIIYTFKSSVSLPAQVADNVLRPVLGSKATIQIESWYFTLGDAINNLHYRIKKPTSNIFTSAAANTSVPLTQDKADIQSMDLKNIPIQHTFSPLPLEGVWQGIPETVMPHQTVMAKTFLRTDPTRNYAIVSLVKMNMQQLAIGVEAGTYYPGGTRKIFGPGIVPKSVQQSNTLLAVFNGGFMEKDGHYGMIVGNKTYVPLRKGLATLVITSDGNAQIIDYQGKPFATNVVGARQNGAFLIRNGIITPFVENGIDTWGRTTTNSMYTWRSGIGITKNGNLIYAVGNALVPQTLAKALKAAGAVDAMQLDINSYWVHFILYTPLGNTHYSYYPLLKDMHNAGYTYLHGYNKDFFYIYKKM